MDKLELKHIAPYLPYKIRVQYEGVTNSKERTEYDKAFFKENGIDKLDVLAPYSVEDYHPPREEKGLKVGYIKIVEYWDKWTVYLIGNKSHGLKKTVNTEDFKLILRPLSDLTTEIEINGETFVPIQLMFYVENQGIEFRYDVKGMVPAIKRTILYGKHEDFDGEEEIGYISHNYKNMFGRYLDKLYEWHFDVFGLIDKGLAIDINTLKGGHIL